MHINARLLAAPVALAALAGCGSLASTPAAQTGAGSPAAAPSSPAMSSPPPCTTHACVVQVLDQSLPGAVAKDESVITKAVCKSSSVKYSSAGNTYTARCTVTYSDGISVTGYGNLLMTQQKVTFEPTGS